MLESYLIWNGVSSEEFDNLMIKKVPSLSRPRRKRDVYSVAGRNGDVIIDQDAYEDIDQEYQLFIYADEKGTEVAERAAEIAEWLYNTDSGYIQLQDSYDAEYVRYAYISDQVEIENALAQFGTVVIPFRMRPERFLSGGLMESELSGSPVQVSNLTKFASRPLFYVESNTAGAATLTVNDVTISISSLQDYLYIDCDEQNVYRQKTENKNSLVTLSGGEFPVLHSGENTISWSSRVSKVVLTPRWWTI